MDMLDPFDPMNPFFQDEFIFNEEDEDENGYRRLPCPDCEETLRFHRDAETVRCRNCGSRFNVN